MKMFLRQLSSVFLSNRLIILTVFLGLQYLSLSAQVNLSVYSRNYMSVNSYAGYTATGAYDVKFDCTTTSLNIPQWKLSVRLLRPIQSDDGTRTFPPEKISFLPVSTEGDAQPLPIPSVSQIGIPASIPLSGTSEAFLVPQSNAPLYNISQYSSYFYLLLKFNLNVAPGEYLANLQGGDKQKRYIVSLEFCLYGKNNEVLGRVTREYTIDVYRLIDNPTPRNKYSIQLAGNAQNSYLELRTLDNYINGTSVTYNNALKLSSNVDYQVTVRSSSPNFSSPSGSLLPLSAVNLQPVVTQSSSTFISSVRSVELSASPQVVVDGKSTSESVIYLDLKYYTKPNNKQLIDAKSDEYKTILIYEITPK